MIRKSQRVALTFGLITSGLLFAEGRVELRRGGGKGEVRDSKGQRLELDSKRAELLKPEVTDRLKSRALELSREAGSTGRPVSDIIESRTNLTGLNSLAPTIEALPAKAKMAAMNGLYAATDKLGTEIVKATWDLINTVKKGGGVVDPGDSMSLLQVSDQAANEWSRDPASSARQNYKETMAEAREEANRGAESLRESVDVVMRRRNFEILEEGENRGRRKVCRIFPGKGGTYAAIAI